MADKENLKRKTNVETDLIEDDATLDGNVAPKAKSKKLNLLNPENFSGAEANVFRQNFEYPPSKEDKVSNNKINKEETLFPNKMRGSYWQSVKKKILKVFEIYIHATQYNPEDAFGCNKCPGELLKGESEDDFEDVKEVHISDGIDMGNMQYPSGKPHVRIFSVQPEFCRKGGGVESPCQMGCGTSLVNMNHY